MTTTLQVISVVDLVPVRKISLASNSPLTLLVEGKNFLSVTGARVNRIEATSVNVLSDSSATVVVPDSMKNELIQEVSMLSSAYSGREASRINFLIGPSPKNVSGLLKVTQQFIKLLVTTPGTDIFHKQEGGGLFQAVGRTMDPNNPGAITGQVMSAINRTRNQIVASQATKRLPLDEKLRRAVLSNLSLDALSLSINIEIGIETMAGRQGIANLGVN